MKKSKNPLKIFYSMGFALGLLLLLCALCTIASLIPQNRGVAYYSSAYSPFMGKLIVLLSFDKAFSSWWFILLTCLLCLNLILCSISKFPQIFNATRKGYTIENCKLCREEFFLGKISPETKSHFLANLGYKKTIQSGNLTYGVKNRVGLWGAWLCHVGMIMLIIGFAAGQLLSYSGSLYGVPQTQREIPSEHLKVTIDDFQVLLREDFTVKQYVADLTVENTKTGASKSGQSMVNNPFGAFGYKFYQNSVGWANDVAVLKNNQEIRKETVYMGEVFKLEELPVAIVLHKFFPDFSMNSDSQPYSRSPLLINPVTQFALYFEQSLVDVNFLNMGHDITLGEYAVRFSNPRQYTLLQLRRDPTLFFVMAGGLVLIMALIMAFYLQLKECLLEETDGVLRVYARSPKGKQMYAEQVVSVIQAMEKSQEKQIFK